MPAKPSASGGRLWSWMERIRRHREHRALLQLPDYLLRDIGVNRNDLRRALSAPEETR